MMHTLLFFVRRSWKTDSCPITFCQCLQLLTRKGGHLFLWQDQNRDKRREDAERRTDVPGSSGIGWSCSASASVFSSVDPPYGSSSFTIFVSAAAFFWPLWFSTLLQGQKKHLLYLLCCMVPYLPLKRRSLSACRLGADETWLKKKNSSQDYIALLPLYIAISSKPKMNFF